MKPKLKELAALFRSTETEVVIFCAAEEIDAIMQNDAQFFQSESAGIYKGKNHDFDGVVSARIDHKTFHLVPHTHQKEFILSLADSIRVDTEVNYPETLGAEPEGKDMPPADVNTGSDYTGGIDPVNTEIGSGSISTEIGNVASETNANTETNENETA